MFYLLGLIQLIQKYKFVITSSCIIGLLCGLLSSQYSDTYYKSETLILINHQAELNNLPNLYGTQFRTNLGKLLESNSGSLILNYDLIKEVLLTRIHYGQDSILLVQLYASPDIKPGTIIANFHLNKKGLSRTQDSVLHIISEHIINKELRCKQNELQPQFIELIYTGTSLEFCTYFSEIIIDKLHRFYSSQRDAYYNSHILALNRRADLINSRIHTLEHHLAEIYDRGSLFSNHHHQHKIDLIKNKLALFEDIYYDIQKKITTLRIARQSAQPLFLLIQANRYPQKFQESVYINAAKFMLFFFGLSIIVLSFKESFIPKKQPLI